MMNTEKIKKLEKEIDDLKEAISGIRAEVTKLKIQDWVEKAGINIGDDVSYIDGRTEKRGVLNHIRVDWSVSPFVRLYKKDGTLGERVSRVWDEKTLKKTE